MSVVAITTEEINDAAQGIIEFMQSKDEIYGKFYSTEMGMVLGQVMFVFGINYERFMREKEAVKQDMKDTIDEIVDKGRGIFIDGNQENN